MKFRKTRLVRTLCRLFGEEKGQAMMEYVVLAVLIVAAAVFAVVKFGGRIANQFGVATSAASGNENAARTAQAESLTETETAADDASGAAAAYSKTAEGGEGGGEGDGSEVTSD